MNETSFWPFVAALSVLTLGVGAGVPADAFADRLGTALVADAARFEDVRHVVAPRIGGIPVPDVGDPSPTSVLSR